MTTHPPPTPSSGDTESPAVAAAEARAVAPLLVSSLETMAGSRLFTVSADALIVEVASRLSSAQISLVVVCDAAGAAVGIITETILVRRLGLGQADFFTTHAGDVMTQDFTTCAPQELLSDVLATMHTRGLIHVVLMGADRKPTGILNTRDGLRALLAAGNYEETLLRNYVMGIGYQ